MAVDILVAKAFPGDPLGPNSKKAWPKRRGKGGRHTPEIIGIYYDTEGLLDIFLTGHPLINKLPMLGRWDPAGRDHYHRGGDLETIAAELEQALESPDVHPRTANALKEVLLLARQAASENLVLHVSFD